MQVSRTITFIIGRRLDEPESGSSVYLMSFIKLARQSRLRVRVVFAPVRSFGTRPWIQIHEDFTALIDEIVWEKSVKVAKFTLSTNPKIWGALLPRLWFGLKSMLKGTANAKPLSQLGLELTENEKRDVQNTLKQHESDLIVAEYDSLGPVLEGIPARSRAIFLHDLFSLRAASFLASGIPLDHVNISIAEEAKRCRFADVLIHASANERRVLKEYLPDVQHFWMRPRFPTPKTQTTSDQSARAVFIGVRHGGNSDALAQLLDNIWPKVRQQLPSAELWVVGTVGHLVPKEIAEGNFGVRVLGRVDDLAEIGGTQSVGLAPTKTASGISIKVIEYMSLNMPVLVLPEALTGYDDALDAYVVKSTDSDEFVSELIKLLENSDRRKEIASRALETVPKLLSNDELLQWLAGK